MSTGPEQGAGRVGHRPGRPVQVAARRFARSLRRGPAMTLVTVAAIVVGIALFFEFGGPSAEVVDRVGIVDGWTFGVGDIGRSLRFPTVADDGVTIQGPEGHVVEAYWRSYPCDTATRVVVEGTTEALRLTIEPRNPHRSAGCEPSEEIFRLTLVANRPLAPGSVTAQLKRQD